MICKAGSSIVMEYAVGKQQGASSRGEATVNEPDLQAADNQYSATNGLVGEYRLTHINIPA